MREMLAVLEHHHLSAVHLVIAIQFLTLLLLIIGSNFAFGRPWIGIRARGLTDERIELVRVSLVDRRAGRGVAVARRNLGLERS